MPMAAPDLPRPSAAQPRLARPWFTQPWLLVALACAAAFHAYALHRFGPLTQPDSDDYLSYARVIQSGWDWIFSASVESVTAFRSIGYPALLAVVQQAAGSQPGVAMVLVQTVLSLAAMVQLHRVGRALGLSDAMAAFAALAYGCGAVAIFNLNLLTDGIFASLAIILVGRIALPLLREESTPPLSLFISGFLLAMCILLRDATLYAAPLFALGAFAQGFYERSWRHGVRAAVIFLLPAIVTVLIYASWNQYRTGHRFITLGSQYAFLMPPVLLEQNGVSVLRDPLLREGFSATTALAAQDFFPRVLEIGRRLQRVHGLDAIARSRLASQAYWTAWGEAPGGMIGLALREYRGNQFLLLVSATHSLRELKSLAGVEATPGYRALVSGWFADPARNALPIAIELAGFVVSGVIFAAFVIGGLHAIWRILRGARDPVSAVLAWFLALYVGFVGMYAIVHLEARYTIAVQALALVGGIFVLVHAFRLTRRASQVLLGS